MNLPDLCRNYARQALLWGSIVAVAILLGGYSHENQPRAVALEIDAEIAAGNILEIFPNEERQEVARATRIQPGQRATYRFADLPLAIERYRVDLTDAAAVRVRLWRLTLRQGSRVLRSFGPAELRRLSWEQASLPPTDSGDSHDYLEITTTGRDPILRLPAASLGISSSRSARLLRQLAGPAWLLLAVPCALFLLLRIRLWGPWLPVILLLFASVRLQGLLWDTPWLRHLLAGYQSSDVAVGFANYIGHPKLAEHRVVLLSVALMAALSAAVACLLRRIRPVAWSPDAPPPESTSAAWHRFTVGAVVIALLIVSLGQRLPDMEEVRGLMLQRPHSMDFDFKNHFTWDYAFWAGWVPLRDFWYPYGDYIQHFTNTALGFGKGLFHVALTWVVIGYCIFALSGRSYPFLALVFGLVTLATPHGLMRAEPRYNLSLGLVLLGVLSRKRGWRLRDGLWLAVWAGYALRYEPHQIAYAVLPIGLLWLVDMLFVPPGTSRRSMLQFLAAAGGALLLFVAVWLLDLARQGRLSGQLAFLLHSAGMVAYASLPSNVWSWFGWPVNRECLLLYSMLLSVGLGVFAWVWGRRGVWADIGTLCLSCGLLGAVTMQKQIVRPHIADQLLPLLALPFLFWLLVLYRATRALSERAALVALTLVLFFTHFGLAPLPDALSYFWIRFSHLPNSIQILADKTGFEAVRQHFYFSPEMYPGLQPLLARLRQLIGPEQIPPLESTRFMVLGDDSYLHVALHQKPAPYLAQYDISPLSVQQRMVRWLAEQKPQYIVWRPKVAAFDNVPHIVRVPHLFAAVVADYEPLETVGDFHILQRRSATRPLDWGYFRREIGSAIDLRALPAHSRLASLPLCSAPGSGVALPIAAGCAPILQVHVALPVDKQVLKLSLSTEHGEFVVSLEQAAGVSDYAISLSSLWFWPSLSRTSPPTALAWSSPAGTTLQISQRAGAAELLF